MSGSDSATGRPADDPAAIRYSPAVDTARDYYNSEDADNFYFRIWGGENIHIGLYRSEDEPIAVASGRTVERMAHRLSRLGPDSRVLDLGSGYAGSARQLVREYGCTCAALNLSETENARARRMNAEQGLADRIEVIDGSFETLPWKDGAFDVVWSQDALLHSGRRGRVLDEAARVLKPGGEMIFTDPMQADDCPPGVLQPILDRIHLETLGSPGFYRERAAESGFERFDFEDHTHQLTTHYRRVLEELEAREGELDGFVSGGYIARMKKGLKHWIEGGRQGYLAWGIIRLRTS